MAGHAQCFGVGLRQNDFPILGGRMADFALLVRKRRMREFCHQLRSRRLVRIVTVHAIGLRKWLVLVRLLQVGALHVVTIDTKGGRRLREVEVELGFTHLARLVRGMASVATHVEGGVPAAFLGNVYAGIVAGQAKVLFLVP
jgi:hypothetical protein